MGVETLLILFGIIGQAVSDDESSSLEKVAEVCLKIGVVMTLIELLILVLVLIAGAGATSSAYRRSRRSRW